VKEELPGGYELDDDRRRIDRAAVHAYVGGESYWAKGRLRETMDGLIERSARVVGLYAPGGEQVGFSRTVDAADAGLVYLADVYVLEGHRGEGRGTAIVRFTVEQGPYADRRWVLHTADAHDLYAKFGFRPGQRLLERQARTPTGSP
jgi:GNAT superfamily N-acetyltransferase